MKTLTQPVKPPLLWVSESQQQLVVGAEPDSTSASLLALLPANVQLAHLLRWTIFLRRLKETFNGLFVPQQKEKQKCVR